MATDKKFITKNGLKTQNIDFSEDVTSSTPNSINVSMENSALTFAGSSIPELFKITDSLNNTIFSVNDEFGVALLEADEDGTIRMGEFVGNVLIGTNTDDGLNKLQVSGNTYLNGNIETTGNITVSGTTTTDTLSVVGGVTIDTDALYVSSTTNRVGIGTASPGYALDVKFAANFQNDILVSGTVDGRDLATDGAKLDLINQGLATTDSPTFVTLNATTVDLGDWTITEANGSLYFATSGVNRMKLDANGNLQVTGDIESLATIS